ncbi:MAG: radical SAM protein, partial [Eubacteriales bacterium]|nr:radical SAM protein [Eubacteriales bacterium]
PCLKGINTHTGIFLSLIDHGVREEDVLYAPLGIFEDAELSEEQRRGLICQYNERTDLELLVLHIVEHCNMSCANCSMFAGLVKHPVFMDYDKTKASLFQLKKYFNQVVVFRLIGGEPLLNKDIGRYCKLVRDIYPFSNIEIVTNGTLIMGMSDELINTLHENNITLDIALYPVLNSKIDEINEFLNHNKIKHYITKEKEVFYKLYDAKGESDRNTAFKKCKMKFNCVNMKENRIAVCYVPFAIPHLRDYFKLDIKESGTIDLFATELSAEKIRRLMNQPQELCRYCCVDDDARWKLLSDDEKSDIRNWSI